MKVLFTSLSRHSSVCQRTINKTHSASSLQPSKYSIVTVHKSEHIPSIPDLWKPHLVRTSATHHQWPQTWAGRRKDTSGRLSRVWITPKKRGVLVPRFRFSCQGCLYQWQTRHFDPLKWAMFGCSWSSWYNMPFLLQQTIWLYTIWLRMWKLGHSHNFNIFNKGKLWLN